jgi:hypothetical protein
MAIINYVKDKFFKTKAVSVRTPKFEDFYIIYRTEFVYLNDPHYEYFVDYLQQNNKIAVIFATAEDSYHIIPNSPYILKYQEKDSSEKDKIIHKLRCEFEAKLNAYEADYVVEHEAITVDFVRLD